MTLLWYVHHHGLGHWRRALAVGALLETPVVFLSSRTPPWELPPHCRFVPLPLDTSPDRVMGGPAGGDPAATADGNLHWAPLGQPGLLARHRVLLTEAALVSRAVVDVSVEVAVLLRVSGIPVVLVQLPGERDDAPHRLARGLASEVVMPVPARWRLAPAGVTATGLVSMLGQSMCPVDPHGPVVVVAGAGGGGLTREALALLAEDHHLVVADGAVDVAPLLAAASVVVGGAGLGTVADVAATGRPFVVFPADRPFGEQAATATACATYENAVLIEAQPASAGEWRSLVSRAVAAGPFCADVTGARRFADLLEAA